MSNKNIRDFFDKHAARWDSTIPAECVARAEEIIAALPMEYGEKVLDVGCGTGVLFPMLRSKVGDGGVIVAADVSFLMLSQARAKTRGQKTLLLQADTTDAPLASASFDWVIAYSVFPHFLDQQQAVIELARVLKPGGWLVICHSKSREDINAFHRTVGDVVGGHELPDDDTMRELIRNAGLRLVSFESLTDRYIVIARS